MAGPGRWPLVNAEALRPVARSKKGSVEFTTRIVVSSERARVHGSEITRGNLCEVVQCVHSAAAAVPLRLHIAEPEPQMSRLQKEPSSKHTKRPDKQKSPNIDRTFGWTCSLMNSRRRTASATLAAKI